MRSIGEKLSGEVPQAGGIGRYLRPEKKEAGELPTLDGFQNTALAGESLNMRENKLSGKYSWEESLRAEVTFGRKPK